MSDTMEVQTRGTKRPITPELEALNKCTKTSIEMIVQDETPEVITIENESDEHEQKMCEIRSELEKILFAENRISKVLIGAILEKYGRGEALVRKLVGRLKYMKARVDEMQEERHKRTMETTGETSKIKQAVAELRQLSFAAMAAKIPETTESSMQKTAKQPQQQQQQQQKKLQKRLCKRRRRRKA